MHGAGATAWPVVSASEGQHAAAAATAAAQLFPDPAWSTGLAERVESIIWTNTPSTMVVDVDPAAVSSARGQQLSLADAAGP